MKPNKNLIDGLIEKNLISPDIVNIENFPALESSIALHVINRPEDHPESVFFDAESIDELRNYDYLTRNFFLATSLKNELSKVTAKYDEATKSVLFEYKKRGKIVKEEWIQDSDWVSAEFLDFIFNATKTKEGEFCEISTGDQFFLAIYMNSDLLKAYNNYKKKSNSSREEFLTSQSESAKHRFGHIKILPRAEYKRVINRFKSTFCVNNLSAPLKYLASENSIVACLIDENRGAFNNYRLVKSISNDIENYLAISSYRYEKICPDGDCYFISLAEPKQEVIFKYEAKYVGRLAGDQEKILGDYLVIGTNIDWGIFVKENRLLAGFGYPVISLMKKELYSIEKNKNAELAYIFTRDYLEPLLRKIGFSQEGLSFDKSFYHRKFNNHWTAMHAIFSQENDEADLIIDIDFRFFLVNICQIVRSESTSPSPASGFDYQLRRFPDEKRFNWSVNVLMDYHDRFKSICDWIEKNIDWLSMEPPMDEAAELYATGESYIYAAVAFAKAGMIDAAEKYFAVAIQSARDSGLGVERKVKSIQVVAKNFGLSFLNSEE